MRPAATFIQALERAGHDKNPTEMFRDFVEVAFCALAKTTSAPEQANALEARYMRIVQGYRSPDTVRVFPSLLGMAQQALEGGGCDFFGHVAGELGSLNDRLGQFFTPYELSRLMAGITLADAGALIREKGHITVCEPACGSGGMVLACADELASQGFDPSACLLVEATDLSELCMQMAFVQLSLRGVPACVHHGNTLSQEVFSSAWTPAAWPFRLDAARHRIRFTDAVPAAAPEAVGQLDLFGAV